MVFKGSESCPECGGTNMHKDSCPHVLQQYKDAGAKLTDDENSRLQIFNDRRGT